MGKISIKINATPQQICDILWIKNNSWASHKRVGKTGGRLGKYLISNSLIKQQDNGAQLPKE